MGDGPLALGDDSSQPDPPPNWRKIAGPTAVGGIVLGIVASIVLIGFVWNDSENPDDGLADGPSTTTDGADLAALITTPPTLPRTQVVTVLHPTTIPALPAIAPPPFLETFGTVPSYPRYFGVPDGGLDSFELTPAVKALAQDIARRSETHIEFADAAGDGETIDFTIVRDPVNDRYRVTNSSRGLVEPLIVDIDSGLSYSYSEPVGWDVLPNAEIADWFDVADLGELFDRLLLGPLRPDTLTSAAITPLPMVFFEGEATIARLFSVELPGDQIPEWRRYVLGGARSQYPGFLPEHLVYSAYVNDSGELDRIVGTATVGAVTQLVIHQIETLPAPEPIELPDPAELRTLDEISG